MTKTDYDRHNDVGVLFDQNDFLQVLKKDMNDARLNITISSPMLKKSHTISMLNYLIGLDLKKENVTIITKPASDYKKTETEEIKELLHQLSESGFTAVARSGVHQKFIVIDEQIIWYGSINLLAYRRADDAMMRFVNKDISGELRGEVESI